MESSSLLGSYIHVVYENKKKVSKNVFEKYFPSEQKFRKNLEKSRFNQYFFKIEKFHVFSSTFHFLNSYGHAVYENKRKVWKKDFRKIFFEWTKISKFTFFENSVFHRPISEPHISFLYLKHSAIDRSRPQLCPGMFFFANGCLMVENELSEVGDIWTKKTLHLLDFGLGKKNHCYMAKS